ncbi:MAG: hypothetical protein RLZZ63_24 [Gemmatimonadota bacterium]
MLRSSPRSLVVSLALFATALPLGSQGTRPAVPRDTTPARDTLEAVVIRATRRGGAAPTSQSTLDRAMIERTYAGQDAPLALQGLTGVTAASDAGTFSGYSSLRLRGIDQTRLAVSVDGVPLNDPEDQVLYFSNVPDFMNSMQSVRIQRGVGASAFGPAGFAGSLSFESLPLATTPAFRELQLTSGSWGTNRVSVEAATGIHRGFATYARLSGQETDGFRERSGNQARSAFVSAGWFGARDAVKVTGFAGRSTMQLAYYAASEEALRVNRRFNPMAPEERDDFWQAMASVQHTRTFGSTAALTTTVYRNAAGGAFDVAAGDLLNFNLDHGWVGLLSTLTWRARSTDVAAGIHLSDYARDHHLKVRPDLETRLYDNTGFKQEQGGFVKASRQFGAVEVNGDLQLRRAAFRYRPTPGSSFADPRIDWLFVNPKVGVTWQARTDLALFASLGQAGREPTRTDLFAGADDLDAAAAAELLPLNQVKPERLTDLELGARLTRGTTTLQVNAFAMAFRDEIAPIGAIAITGSQLRRNVDRSSRLGVEVEGAISITPTLGLRANAMVMRARITEFEDEASGVVYRDVRPVLTPSVLANVQAIWQPRTGWETILGVRHVGDAPLANDGNAALVTPAFTMVDGDLSVPIGRQRLRVQGLNLLDTTAYAAGYTDGTTRYLFPVAARTWLATVQVTF